MKQARLSARILRFVPLVIWVAFTVALSGWWIYFGFQQIERLSASGYGHASELFRFQKMVLWEGTALIICIVIGAAAIGYFMYRELRQRDKLRNFFVALTHDLKTALAAVSLQGELIREKLKDPGDRELADRFLADTGRLTLQLENSLTLANLEERNQHLEPVRISEIVQTVGFRFPALKISLNDDAVVKGDVRSVEGIFANICQNAIVHGGAKAVAVTLQSNDDQVSIALNDDGQGFQGDRKKLSTQFHRHYSGSGSGLGLYIAAQLARSMGGRLEFPTANSGFTVVVSLPGAVGE